MTLLVATTNPGKLREITPILADMSLDLRTLADISPPIPPPAEDAETFWENARAKALAYAAASGLMTVAEDSGLVVDALGGEPGVRSARFLGDDVPYQVRFAEINRRLALVGGGPHRARFVTALAVAAGARIVYETEAAVDGTIAATPSGSGGFGYDPIFQYPPFGCTTADMNAFDKAAVSHRARAFRDLRRAMSAQPLAFHGA